MEKYRCFRGSYPMLDSRQNKKKQNGRRFKEDGDPMFTLTGQDRHGVMVKQAVKTDGTSTCLVSAMGCGGGYVPLWVEAEVIVIDDTQGFDGVRTYKNESPTLRSQRSGLKVAEVTKQGFAIAHEYDSINLEQPNSETKGMRVGKQIANTLTCGCNQAVDEPNIQNYRIRKLTPKECWRLMGFTDKQFQKAQDAGVSNSQLYKQAGNSIVVDVLEHIFMNLFKRRL